MLVDSGLKAEALPDLLPAQRSKLIFNATVNGVAALTGLRHDRHFAAEGEPSDLGHLVHELVDEGKSVAAAAGVELYDDPWEMNFLATKRGSAHYPSMLEDVDSHRPTEVELINGSLVREAELAGVAAPLHTAAVPVGQGEGGELHGQGGRGVRVCVVGCGAVGSLFAANLAQLEDVEVWAHDLAADHVAAINPRRSQAERCRRRARQAAGHVGRGQSCRRATSASSRRRRCTPRPRWRRRPMPSPTAASPPCRTGLGNEEAIGPPRAFIRGTTFPAGKVLEPGHVQWDVKG